ncbi:RNA-directed DNA polymerase, partial [Thiolapillus sp.]|uniref:RNA-directed DNA polymerase n=1 Tax=Thiolapillus sp. TaxID=2017437 RepID=UPI003AF64011
VVVIPLLKKNNQTGLDANSLNNYRPVSNLPFLSKVLEKVVLHQLRGHLLANNLSETFQSAYRAHHSTETALLDVTNCLLGSADEGRVSILTLLDLSAAFDTLDHSILLTRLHDMFGISGKAFEWFSSYLSDRFQSVSVNGRVSSQKKLHYGVPQGSVLGPILFTLYTQPLSDIISQRKCNHHKFADDTQLH